MKRTFLAVADIILGILIVCAVSLLTLILAALMMWLAFGPTLGFD